MKRSLTVFAALVAAFAFSCQGARAGDHHGTKVKLAAVSIGVGAAATAGYFALNNWQWNWSGANAGGLSQAGAVGVTTIGCMAVSPMVATVVLNRQLTMREGHYLIASCILPVIGGWIVNAAYDAHPEWEPGVKVHGKKKHAKM